MRLFGRRTSATLTLSPEQPLRPTETVQATVVVEQDLDQVTAAHVELGYINSYRYRWAGRRAALARHDDTSLLTVSTVGTDAGSERATSDWVGALAEPLPLVDGRLPAGRHRVALRLPSWSPGSSSIVAWQVRLRVERDGRDVEEDAALTVLVPAPDPAPAQPPVQQGTRILFNSVYWEITTEQPSYRPGEEVRGVVTMTAREPTDRAGQLALTFSTEQLSHPLTRTPGSTTESMTRPVAVIAEGLRLVQGVPLAVPFAVVVPAEVQPTTEAVHSSLTVYLQARVMFSGLTGGVESARREIVVHTG